MNKKELPPHLRLQQVCVCHCYLLASLDPLNAPHDHPWPIFTISCKITNQENSQTNKLKKEKKKKKTIRKTKTNTNRGGKRVIDSITFSKFNIAIYTLLSLQSVLISQLPFKK